MPSGMNKTGPQDRKTARLQDRKTARPQDRKTARQQDRKSARPQVRKTARPQDRKTARQLYSIRAPQVSYKQLVGFRISFYLASYRIPGNFSAGTDGYVSHVAYGI